MKKKAYILAAVIVIIAAIIGYLASGEKEDGVTYATATVATSNISTSITATGTIEPVTSVSVGTQVSGIVAHLYVDYNSIVKKGQVIAELDKTNLLSELASTKANLASAKANLAYQANNFQRHQTLFDMALSLPTSLSRHVSPMSRHASRCRPAPRMSTRHRQISATPPSLRPSTASCSPSL